LPPFVRVRFFFVSQLWLCGSCSRRVLFMFCFVPRHLFLSLFPSCGPLLQHWFDTFYGWCGGCVLREDSSVVAVVPLLINRVRPPLRAIRSGMPLGASFLFCSAFFFFPDGSLTSCPFLIPVSDGRSFFFFTDVTKVWRPPAPLVPTYVSFFCCWVPILRQFTPFPSGGPFRVDVGLIGRLFFFFLFLPSAFCLLFPAGGLPATRPPPHFFYFFRSSVMSPSLIQPSVLRHDFAFACNGYLFFLGSECLNRPFPASYPAVFARPQSSFGIPSRAAFFFPTESRHLIFFLAFLLR